MFGDTPPAHMKMSSFCLVLNVAGYTEHLLTRVTGP